MMVRTTKKPQDAPKVAIWIFAYVYELFSIQVKLIIFYVNSMACSSDSHMMGGTEMLDCKRENIVAKTEF